MRVGEEELDMLLRDMQAEADRMRARLAAAERDNAQWKKAYDLRGRALQRPCISCGHVPLTIHADAAIDAAIAGDSTAAEQNT